jgi:hypothetical protein
MSLTRFLDDLFEILQDPLIPFLFVHGEEVLEIVGMLLDLDEDGIVRRRGTTAGIARVVIGERTVTDFVEDKVSVPLDVDVDVMLKSEQIYSPQRYKALSHAL